MSPAGNATCTAPAAGSCDAQNPWPGLLQYQEADKQFFRGREAETDALLRMVMRARLSLLFGLSGLGKTSLLQAGLFPLLRNTENILPIYIRLDFSSEHPDFRAQVLQALLNEAAASGVEAPSPGVGNEDPALPEPTANNITLWEYFHRTGADFWDRKNRPVTPLFVFDQFEEVFTVGQSSPATALTVASFLDELSDLAEGRAPQSLKERLETHPREAEQYSFSQHNYKILLTVREDFLPEIEGLRGRFSDLPLNRMRLRPMNGEAALAVVRQAPELVDEDVAEQMVRFVAAAQPGKELAELETDPAILSVICYELNNQRRKQREAKITRELLEGSGQSIISDYYANAVSDLPDVVHRFIEDELITGRGFRKTCDMDDALNIHGVSKQDLYQLVNRRVLRIETQHGSEQVELTHDLLTGVVRQHRESRRERERKETEEQRERERRSRRLRRTGIASVCGVAILCVVLATIFYHLVLLAISGKLAAEALARKDTRVDLASLFSVTAYKTKASVESENALLATLQSNPRLLTYLHHSSGVLSVAFSPDGRTLATGSSDGTVQLWDASNRKPLGKPLTDLIDPKQNQNEVNTVVFRDARTLAAGSQNGRIVLWNVAGTSPPEPSFINASGPVLSMTFSPDGKTLASASSNQLAKGAQNPCTIIQNPTRIMLWDVASRQLLKEFKGHRDTVRSVAFSPDGRTLASGSDDGFVFLWNVATTNKIAALIEGKPLDRKGCPPSDVYPAVISVAFSPDGKMLAGGGLDHEIALWDVASHEQLSRSSNAHWGPVQSLTFVDTRTLASASWDNTARLWDLSHRQLEPLGEPLVGHTDGVLGLAYSPTLRFLASASRDTTVILWDATRKEPPEPQNINEKVKAEKVAFSPDGTKLAAMSWRGTLQIWNVPSQDLRLDKPIVKIDVGKVESMAFSPDGRTLALGGANGKISLFDLSNQKLIVPPFDQSRDDTNPVTTLAFSSDGKLLASGGGILPEHSNFPSKGDGTVRLWDVASQKLLGELRVRTKDGVRTEDAVLTAAFSPDGRRLASADWEASVREAASLNPISTIQLWDLDIANRQYSQLVAQVLTGHSNRVIGMAYSPDSRTLASASWDHTVRLWDVASRKSLAELKGHTDAVLSVAFSPDGKMLASSSWDMTVRLWDVATHEPLGVLTGHRGPVVNVVFSPDGRTLASVGDDDTVLLWPGTLDSWVTRACQRANRNLTPSEWQQYIGANVPYRLTCPDLPGGSAP